MFENLASVHEHAIHVNLNSYILLRNNPIV